jgi:hypothetical protein
MMQVQRYQRLILCASAPLRDEIILSCQGAEAQSYSVNVHDADSNWRLFACIRGKKLF